jgi:hypothetical protein
MTTQINGDTGVSQCQPNSVSQDDLQSGVVGKGLLVRAVVSAAQSIPNNSSVVKQFSTEFTDTDNAWNGSRFQPNVAGFYLVSWSIQYPSGGTGERSTSLRQNGSVTLAGAVINASSGGNPTVSATFIASLNGTTDYLEVMAYQNSGAAIDTTADASRNYFSAVLVRAA